MKTGAAAAAVAALCIWMVNASAHAGATTQSRRFTAFDLLSMRQIGGENGTLSVSPDKQFVAFQVLQPRIIERDYRLAWFVAALNSPGRAVRVGDGGEVNLAPGLFGRINGHIADIKPAWSPDSKTIAYLRGDNGEIQVWSARADGSKETQLTRNAADVVDFRWGSDGRRIYFTVERSRNETRNAELREGDLGYLLDDRFAPTYSRKPLWLACNGGIKGIPHPESQPCVSALWVLDLGGGERKASTLDEREFELLSESRPVGSGQPTKDVTDDASRRENAWFENEDPKNNPGYNPPLTLHADNGRCGAPECHGMLREMWWYGDEVVFRRSEGHALGLQGLYAWRPKDGATRLIYRSEAQLESCESADSRLICLYEAPKIPRKIVAIDIWSGTQATIYDPNPEFASFELGEVEKLEWLDAFGNETYGHLVYPSDYQSSRRYPLVIVQYRSRGFLNGGVGNEYPIFPLAENGFLVLSFDRPEDRKLDAQYKAGTLAEMATLQGAAWKDAYTHKQALTALDSIITFLSRRGLIDARRVGITGLSNGAETVDYSLTRSKLFAAAAMSGNASPFFYYEEVNESMRAVLRAQFGAASAKEVLENWAQLSMTARAEKVTAPLLIQVSDVELVSTAPSFIALKEAGKPVEAYVFPDEYHVKWKPQHKLAVAERTIDWFAFWLKNEEAPDGTKRPQYERWRDLRKMQSSE